MSNTPDKVTIPSAAVIKHDIAVFATTYVTAFVAAWQAAGSQWNVSALIALVPSVAVTVFRKLFPSPAEKAAKA